MTLKEMKEQLEIMEWLYGSEIDIIVDVASTHDQYSARCLTGNAPNENGKVTEVILWAH